MALGRPSHRAWASMGTHTGYRGQMGKCGSVPRVVTEINQTGRPWSCSNGNTQAFPKRSKLAFTLHSLWHGLPLCDLRAPSQFSAAFSRQRR